MTELDKLLRSIRWLINLIFVVVVVWFALSLWNAWVARVMFFGLLDAFLGTATRR